MSGSGLIEAFIYAADVKIEVARDNSCAAAQGSRGYSGTFRITTVKNGDFLASFGLGRRTFTEHRTEEISEIHFPESSSRLIALSQYQSCLGDEVEFYRVDSRGGLHAVSVANKRRHEKVTNIE